MRTWQRRARLVIAIAAVAFAIVVAFAFKPRQQGAGTAAVDRTDPQALVETAGGRTIRINREHEDIAVEYERLLTYPDRATRMLGVKVVTQRAGGRTLTMTGKEGSVAQKETDFVLTGDVRLADDAGMTVRTEQATFAEDEGILRAPGPVAFSRGRTSGTAVGFTYDKNRDVLTLLGRVSMQMTPDAQGAGAMDVSGDTAEFDRVSKTIVFGKGLKAIRGRQTIQSDVGTVRLSPDDERLEAIELRGRSRVGGADAGVGGLRSMDGRDVDLKYGPDGEALEHAVVAGNAVIRLAGARGQAGRQISGGRIELAFAPDGVTPISLSGRDSVQLVLPAEPGSAGRTINAASLDSRGEPGRGLTSAHFEGDVRYREQGPGLDRRATSQALDIGLRPGLSAIEDARFLRTVRFQDGSMTAAAAEARYQVEMGTLILIGDSGAAPRVDNDRIAVDAARIDITLAGPLVRAAGTVKSTLKPPSAGAGRGGAPDTVVPAMLKRDQDVTVMANSLDYDGTRSHATYSGDARLYQGETMIRGETIALDDKTGNLSASGAGDKAVMTSMTREEVNAGGKAARVNTTATAKNLKYEETERRLTYAGAAHVSGPDGDMTADTIELYLRTAGDEIDRVEAYDGVTLVEQSARKTTGNRMTYLSADEQYVIGGTPVVVLDTCGRETRGRTLTLYKASDRIVVDGDTQSRTQTRGGSNCP